MALPCLMCSLVFYHSWNEGQSYSHDLVAPPTLFSFLSFPAYLEHHRFPCSLCSNNTCFSYVPGTYPALSYLRALAHVHAHKKPGICKGLVLLFNLHVSTQKRLLRKDFTYHLS